MRCRYFPNDELLVMLIPMGPAKSKGAEAADCTPAALPCQRVLDCEFFPIFPIACFCVLGMLCAPWCHLIQASYPTCTRLEVQVGGIPLFLLPAASAHCSAGQQAGVPLTPAVGREMHHIHMRCCSLCCCSAEGTCAALPRQTLWCFPCCLMLCFRGCPFSLWKEH